MSLVIFEDDLKKERASAEKYKRATAAKLKNTSAHPLKNTSGHPLPSSIWLVNIHSSYNILTLIIKSACHQALARLQHHMFILASM
jgi:hypothetical protein